jgi:HipA-like C-terminal domain
MPPMVSLVHSGGRYVARTQDGSGTPIIAKLPTVEIDGLPRLEQLSLQLPAAAGVNVCRTRLAPISDILDHHHMGLDHTKVFLAVERFDRQGTAHIHCEHFAQVLGVLPEAKSTHPLAGKTIRDTVALAVQTWPRLLDAAPVSPLQKQKILRHFDHSPLVVSHRKRLVKRTT